MTRVLVGCPSEFIGKRFARDMQEAGQCETRIALEVDDFHRNIKNWKPDLIMIDGVAARNATHYKLGKLVKEYKKYRFGVFMYEEVPIRIAARFVYFGAIGVIGFRYHDETEIKQALRQLLNGKDAISNNVRKAVAEYSDVLNEERGLTEKEIAVFHLVVRNFDTDEISRTMVTSKETVRNHIKHIHKKLGTRDRAELVATAYDLGEIPTSKAVWKNIDDTECDG